ncbi:hypothetical protein D1BOALGB6SA_10761 [Olavius sp. associated proteobacterium Delta 1]|nr:hypothetical protein D1BOALGB6SA_10761 [Olavius sp. associated proteobacterium Delta 1]
MADFFRTYWPIVVSIAAAIAALVVFGRNLADMILKWRDVLKPSEVEPKHTDSIITEENLGPDEKFKKLLAELTSGVKSGEAKAIEDQLYEMSYKDVGLFIRHIDQYVPAAREAMVAVGGRLLYSGVKGKVIEEFVQKSTFDSDRWVKRKAEHAMSMLAQKNNT